MLLSIIIPIYKVEKYIDKCLNSIFSQNVSPEDFEVICVNDGTPDNSMQIVNRYAEKYTNLYIINQQNQGLSVARNSGMAIAKGDYLWFVDSDDFVTDNSLVLIKAIIKRNHNDIFGFCVKKINENNGSKSLEKPSVKNISYNTAILGKKCYGKIQTGMVQRYVFRRNFLTTNKLKFLSGVWYEDQEFLPKAIFLADSVELTSDISYNYLVRSGGNIMSTIKLKSIVDCGKINKSLQSFSHRYSKSYKDKAIFWDAEFDNLNFILGCQKLNIEGYDAYMKDKIKPYKKKAVKLALKSIQYRTRTKIRFIISNFWIKYKHFPHIG